MWKTRENVFGGRCQQGDSLFSGRALSSTTSLDSLSKSLFRQDCKSSRTVPNGNGEGLQIPLFKAAGLQILLNEVCNGRRLVRKGLIEKGL